MKYLFLAFALCMPMAMSAQQTLNISVKNPLSTDRTDQPVVLSLQDYGEVRSALVTCGGQEIPCQLDDINLDEQFDELCFLSDLKGKEINYQRVAREVRFSYPEIKNLSIGKGAEVDDSLKVTDRTIIIARSAKPMPASQIKKVEEWLQLRLEDSTAVVHNIVEGKKR